MQKLLGLFIQRPQPYVGLIHRTQFRDGVTKYKILLYDILLYLHILYGYITPRKYRVLGNRRGSSTVIYHLLTRYFNGTGYTVSPSPKFGFENALPIFNLLPPSSVSPTTSLGISSAKVTLPHQQIPLRFFNLLPNFTHLVLEPVWSKNLIRRLISTS